MRRRVHEGALPPAELLVFNGRPYKTEAEWEAAFAEWHAARRAWGKAHGLDPEDDIFDGLGSYEIDGDCPFDPADV